MKEIIIWKYHRQKFVVLVSDEDYDFLMQWQWHISGGGYAARRSRKSEGKRRMLYMHRVILERKLDDLIPDGFVVDHIDRNTVNNTRENLRTVTKRENCFNQARYDRFAHAKRFQATGVRFIGCE
jgi:hypothetical protein